MSRSSAEATPYVVVNSNGEEPVLDFARAVAVGLSERPRSLPCRYLYDARGSELFEQICDLPEYYLTRAETSILARRAGEISEVTGPVTLIELGSGTSVKTDYLLSAYCTNGETVQYVPVDVSEFAIRLATDSITERHPQVEVAGIVGTYETSFPLFKEHSPSMVIFLGSTIGNFERTEARAFWRQVEENLSPGDYFLLGVDLVKEVDVLEAAYNDVAGVTAQFIKNLFARMNRELGSDVDLEQIEHVARYNTEAQQVEISLKFLSEQDVYLGPLEQSIRIEAGEHVEIEVSRKFVVDELVETLPEFGLETERVYTDDEGRFAELLLRRR